jgi:hypothetical protein
VKRLRWSAVLVGLVLMLSWAGAAQAETPTDQTTSGPTEGQVVTPPPPQTPPAAEPPAAPAAPAKARLCSPDEGLTSGVDEIKISTDTAGEHPTASASFTVREAASSASSSRASTRARVSCSTPDPSVPGSGEVPASGPGEHTLTVDLPYCSQFAVNLHALRPTRNAPAPAPQVRGAAPGPISTQLVDQEDVVLGSAEADTTCPTSASAPPDAQPAPTATVAADELPFTGSSTVPLLIAALVLVAGGGALLYAARLRGRHPR